MTTKIEPRVTLDGNGPGLAMAVFSQLWQEQGKPMDKASIQAYLERVRTEELTYSTDKLEQAAIQLLGLGSPIPESTNAPANAPATPQGQQIPGVTEERVGLDVRVERMLAIAQEQECWDKAGLAQLRLDAIAEEMTPAQLSEKLKSIQIHPAPINAPEAPGGNGSRGQGTYNLGAALEAWYLNEPSRAPAELAASQEVLRDLSLPIAGRPGVLAVPFEELYRLSSTISGVTGTTGVSAGAGRQAVMYRADRADPAVALLGLMDRRTVRDGQLQPTGVTVPTPVATAEPGNDGYASTGDLSVDGNTLNPLIIQSNFQVSRAANLTIQDLLIQGVSIGSDKVMEQLVAAVLWGSGVAPAATGIYNADGRGSSAELSGVAGITQTVVTAALQSSYEGGNRRIVCSPAARNHLRTLALPTGVAPMMVDEEIDGVPVVQTMSSPTVATKPARAIIGDFSEILLGIWGGSVFLTRGFYRGLEEVYLEIFFNLRLKRAVRLYRLRQD